MERIRLGVCAPIEHILAVERAGYDYIEANLSALAVMQEREYRAVHARVSQSGIRPEVFGCMLPRELSVTGRGVNAALLHEYLDFAFSRARRLGGEVVVFASAGARQVPESFPFDMAWRQMVNFLRLAERHATDYGLTIAVEPLSRGECNLLSTVAEAVLLCSILQLPHVRVMADSYHMAMEHEPLEDIRQAGALLCHVHTANALGRTFPRAGDAEDYKALFWMLDEARYEGRVSVEAAYDSFEEDALRAFQVLDAARKSV